GFIDGSWQDRSEDHLTGSSSNDSQDVSLDEVELNFLLNAGNVSGEIHIDDTSNEGVNIEQAHFTYTLDNGLSVTFGRYGSKLGLEGEDPAGIYTFSRAYETGAAANYGDVDSFSMEGIALGYATDSLSFNLSLDQSVGDNLKNANEGLNYELAVSYTGVDNLVANIGYRVNQEGDNTPLDIESTHLNVNASYTIGKALIAAEWQEASNDNITLADNGDVEAYQILVDYDFSDKLGATVRYSGQDSDDDSTSGLEVSKFTVAPNYAITSSLGLIVEYSAVDVDTAGAASADYDYLAAELTFTF
ncbi:MAG: outer membrane beta-barrel protein, partial [Opitutales bacterium]|nr:outer membrane beta-barrel protein [Opitutales bacterium]